MEKNIKRVEKLVHATSSTLAQMKLSLMFDDMNGGKSGQLGRRAEGFHAASLEKFLEADDLNLRQNEFQLEASETLAKMDRILAPSAFSRKYGKPLDRIKEINEKMNHLKLEQSKREETKQSRQKLLNLISEEKFSPGMTSGKESLGSKLTARFNEEMEPSDKLRPVSRKTESVLTAAKSPMKPKAELKNKILETQDIVDRGFQTARKLAQKVECLTKWDKKDRTPSTGKTVSEIDSRSLERKTESNETVRTVKCRKCSVRKKKRRTGFREGKQVNTRVIDIKRNGPLEKVAKFNLQLQHLPSMDIKGELKVQKIHNLEIPASEEIPFEKTNIAVSFFSHEQMEREKMEKVLKKIREQNCGCVESESRTNYVECFNCGKLIRIRETCVDPRKIDEVLRKCDFNVFDPRIDEFVEKYGGADSTNRCEETRPPALNQSDVVVAAKLEVLPKATEELPQTKTKEEPKKRKRFTLRDLSDQLCKKYKEEADALADSHLKLDAILQNLFRKVEESKEVFATCPLLRNYRSDPERAPVLTATKPVLVTLPGISLLVRNKQKKLDKKDVKNRSKSRTEFLDAKEFPLSTPSPFKSFKGATETRERSSPLFHSDWNKSSLPEAKEKTQKKFFASAVWESGTVKHPEIIKEEEAPPSSHSSSSFCKSDSDFRGKKISKTLIMASVEGKNSKHPENESLIERSFSKSKTAKSPETKKEEIEEEGESSAASSISSGKSRATSHTDFTVKSTAESKYFLTSAPRFINKDVEKKLPIKLPSKSPNTDKDEEEKAAFCQTPSEKSENNYESDFESFTNESEGKENEGEDEEPEINPIIKKLSTISEVDSEIEKKFSDDEKTPCLEKDRKPKFVIQKEGNSVTSGISAKSKKTEVTPAKTAEASPKSTPSELVTSLRDILTALQDQFARTESLAEKLTENSKVEEKEKAELFLTPTADAILNPWEMTAPAKLVENLQSSRKNWSPAAKAKFSLTLPEKPATGRNKISEGISSADGASEEGGSSLGEVIVSEGIKNNSATSDTSYISEDSILNLSSEERSSVVASHRKEMVSISVLNLVN